MHQNRYAMDSNDPQPAPNNVPNDKDTEKEDKAVEPEYPSPFGLVLITVGLCFAVFLFALVSPPAARL